MRHHKAFAILAAFLVAAVVAPAVMAQVKSHEDIKYPKIRDFQIERPETFTLPNGMRVFLMEDRELPLIEIDARIRTGRNYEPADKVGLAGIFGQVQREGGTSKMTGDEMDDFLEARAASVETSIGGDSGYASMDCLKDDFDDVLQVFSDVLRDPAFAADKIDLAKVQENTNIARRNDSISGIVGREFRRLMYGPETPLGRMTEYATVANVEREDLIAWHQKYYHPNNVLLGVVGDFDSAEMKKKITAQFSDWKKGPDFGEKEPEYDRKPDKSGVYFIEKEDVTQAYVRMGHLGISTDNPDYHAVQVMNEVLGGSFASRLFSNVRSEKGLAYSVFGGVYSNLSREGVCQVGLSTKSGTMGEAVDALREEVMGIINNPATEDELKRAKDSILNSFVFNYDSKGEILGQQLTYAYFGYPEDFLEQYRTKIDAVNKDDVARVAKKYVLPDQAALLVVGKSADFDRPMSSFGEVTEIDITIPDPPDTREAVNKSPESLKAGSELFARAAKTVNSGGTKVDSVQVKQSMAISMQGQKISMGQEVSLDLPDKMHVSVSTPMGKQEIVINGDKGSMSMGGQSQPLPQAAIDNAHEQLSRDLLYLSTQLDSGELEAVAAGKGEVNGTACEVVSVTLRGTESRLCVGENGQVLQQSYQGKHPFTQAPGQVIVNFSDYRDVDGLMLPHQQTMLFEGNEVSTSTVESYAINPQMDAAKFEVPAS